VDGTWHFLAGVYDGQNQLLYVDGSLAVSQAIQYTITNDSQLSIGGLYTGCNTANFAGSIDEVRIYKRALSSNEVQQLYQLQSSCIPHRATATAQLVNGFVVGATITDGGCGYTNTPAVAIEGGGGSGAIATAVVSNGVVVGITIWDAGRDYTSTPTVYIYSPLGVQIGLIKAVRPFFSDLLIGTNYQLQVSGDLNTWTNSASPFPATSRSMVYPQYWDVGNWSQLFFRLQVAP
jgi:hypothetical protein